MSCQCRPCKAAVDVSSSWSLPSTWEIWIEFLAPKFVLTCCGNCVHLEANQQMGTLVGVRLSLKHTFTQKALIILGHSIVCVNFFTEVLLFKKKNSLFFMIYSSLGSEISLSTLPYLLPPLFSPIL